MTDAIELVPRFAVHDGELSALHHLAFHPDEPPGAGGVQPWARRLERHSLTWVGAFRSGVLVGFVHAVWDGGTHAFVLDTVVHPAVRRRGIGRELVRSVTEAAFAAGCEWVHVDYEPDNAGFYRYGCGFRPTPAGLRHRDD